MARRAARTPSPRKPRKGRGAAAPEAGGLQVSEATDGEEAEGPGHPLEAGLVLVTFVALLLALILIEVEMSSSYGSTWPF